MHVRRDLVLIASGMGLLLAAWACGLGSMPQAAAPAPAAATDLNLPSGAGGGIAPTQTLAAQFLLLTEPTAAGQEPSAPISAAPPPAIPESRRLTLEYPVQIRTGDSDVVRLTLEVDTLGNVTPTAEVHGNLVTGQTVQIPNLYETHNIIAEAQVDLAGMDLRPSEPVSEPLLAGEAVTFRWSVHPTEPGVYRGTVWMFLVFDDKVTRQQSRKAISAQTLQIEATTFLGLRGDAARVMGGLGSVVGGVLGIPFADELLKWVWSRIRGRP